MQFFLIGVNKRPPLPQHTKSTALMTFKEDFTVTVTFIIRKHFSHQGIFSTLKVIHRISLMLFNISYNSVFT